MLARYFFSVVVITAIIVTAVPLRAEEVNELVLEELAYAVIRGDLTEENFFLLQGLDQDQVDRLNIIIQWVAGEASGGGPVRDGCENIFNWSLAGYSYVKPYTYWLKWEWNGPDLMLEYAFWPPDRSKNHPKAFWITSYNLYKTLSPCEIAVAYDEMESGKRRVTAVIGYSKWYKYGASSTAANTLLGFRLN